MCTYYIYYTQLVLFCDNFCLPNIDQLGMRISILKQSNEDITTTFSDGLDPKCRCTGLGMAQTGPGLEPFHEFRARTCL